MDSLQNLKSLNLNGCRKISDVGLEAISSACLEFESFSIYWNVRFGVTSSSTFCYYILVPLKHAHKKQSVLLMMA